MPHTSPLTITVIAFVIVFLVIWNIYKYRYFKKIAEEAKNRKRSKRKR